MSTKVSRILLSWGLRQGLWMRYQSLVNIIESGRTIFSIHFLGHSLSSVSILLIFQLAFRIIHCTLCDHFPLESWSSIIFCDILYSFLNIFCSFSNRRFASLIALCVTTFPLRADYQLCPKWLAPLTTWPQLSPAAHKINCSFYNHCSCVGR